MIMPDDDPPPPDGVTLRDPDDTATLRKSLEDNVQGAFRQYVHGYSYGGTRLELDNVHLADKERYSGAEIDQAKMNDKFLSRRLRADVRLVDDVTNEVLDTRKNYTLARLPYLTDEGTFIQNGSAYTPINQLRLVPGAYSRRTQSGELETHFNSRPGTGAAMRVTFNPETAQYGVQFGKANLHAYSFFKSIGVTDDELERRWGRQILDLNKSRFDKTALSRAYQRSVPKWEREEGLDEKGMAERVRAALDRAQVADSILRRNLPNLFDREKSAAWRAVNVMFSRIDEFEKSAEIYFDPDLTPEQTQDSILDFDFEAETLQMKAASEDFLPDLQPDEMREAVNAIYGGRGPRLASMKSWPAKWLDDQDSMGWLQWYEAYGNGRRSDTDEAQINRWKSFKRRHGAQFITNPTPRRAFALRNWAIDPLKLLREDQRADMERAMSAYKNAEHVKWALRRAPDPDRVVAHLAGKLKEKGHGYEKVDFPTLLEAAESGHLEAKDVMEMA